MAHHIITNIENPKKTSGFWADFIITKKFYWVSQLETISQTEEFKDILRLDIPYQDPPALTTWESVFTYLKTGVELKNLIKFVNHLQNHRLYIAKNLQVIDDLSFDERRKVLCPMRRAMWQGDSDFISLLIDCNIKVSIHIACMIGQLEIVKVLLNNQHSNINSRQSMTQWTPLHCAVIAKTPNVSLIEFLLEYDQIDVNCKDFIGFTPFDHAKLKGLPEIILLIHEKLAEKNPEVLTLLRKKRKVQIDQK